MDWHPQVFEDHHEGFARIFTPPNPDIINPNISPIGRMGWLMMGGHIDQQAATENLPGYVSGYNTEFDMWYPGYGDTWPTFHGAYGMTFETAAQASTESSSTNSFRKRDGSLNDPSSTLEGRFMDCHGQHQLSGRRDLV